MLSVRRWLIQAHATHLIPIGVAGENYSRNGWGFGAEILTNISGPVMAGLHVTGARFGGYGINYTEVFEGELFEYEEYTASRVLMSHLAVRFEPDLDGPFSTVRSRINWAPIGTIPTPRSRIWAWMKWLTATKTRMMWYLVSEPRQAYNSYH